MRRVLPSITLFLTIAHVNSVEAAPTLARSNASAPIGALLLRSSQGDAEAQQALGDAYAEGNGVMQSDKAAVRWYRKAADQGLASAQSALAGMIFNGRAGSYDPRLAEQWLHKAADQGFAVAQYNLGVLYLDKRDVTDDPLKSQDWIRRAAEQGLPIAQYALGRLYLAPVVENSSPLEDRQKLAFAWYKKAADQGYAIAQYDLGKMIWGSEDPGPKAFTPEEAREHAERAIPWYRKAADGGLAVAQYEYARTIEGDSTKGSNKSRLIDALVWYLPAARQGLPEAQERLGWIYLGGLPDVKRDYERAIDWTEKAAKTGNYDARLLLCAIYDSARGLPISKPLGTLTGVIRPQTPEEKRIALALGATITEPGSYCLNESNSDLLAPVSDDHIRLRVPFDESQTADWYRRAAELGNTKAQYRLAIMFANGFGVVPNARAAEKWLRKAADDGDANAQVTLAELIDSSDSRHAKIWYERAAQQGDGHAQLKLAQLIGQSPQAAKIAFGWYLKAAENGVAEAAFFIAEIYDGIGEGAEDFARPDKQSAVKWYRVAAEHGNLEAQERLARHHHDGESVNENVDRAKD